MTIPNCVLQKENVAITFGTAISSYVWPDSALDAALKYIMAANEKADQAMKRRNVAALSAKTSDHKKVSNFGETAADAVFLFHTRYCECPLLALSGHGLLDRTCPLLAAHVRYWM